MSIVKRLSSAHIMKSISDPAHGHEWLLFTHTHDAQYTMYSCCTGQASPVLGKLAIYGSRLWDIKSRKAHG